MGFWGRGGGGVCKVLSFSSPSWFQKTSLLTEVSTLVWHTPSSRFSWVRENVCSWRRSSSDMFNRPWAYSWSPSLHLLFLCIPAFLCEMLLRVCCLHICVLTPWNTAAHPCCDTLLRPSPPQHLAWHLESLLSWPSSSSFHALIFSYFPLSWGEHVVSRWGGNWRQWEESPPP